MEGHILKQIYWSEIYPPGLTCTESLLNDLKGIKQITYTTLGLSMHGASKAFSSTLSVPCMAQRKISLKHLLIFYLSHEEFDRFSEIYLWFGMKVCYARLL